MSEYSQSYIDKFMYRWNTLRCWVLGCAIGFVPFAFLNLMNGILWDSLLIGFIATTGLLWMCLCVLVLMFPFFWYDTKKIKVDAFVRNRRWDIEEREHIEMMQARWDRGRDDQLDHFLNEKVEEATRKLNHFDEDLFKI